jgi:hypothetical protein
MARPKMKKSDKKQAVSITLYARHIKQAKKRGNGNISQGVRDVLDNDMKNEISKDKQQGE